MTILKIFNRLFRLVPNPFERRLYKTTYNPRRHSAYATVPGIYSKKINFTHTHRFTYVKSTVQHKI